MTMDVARIPPHTHIYGVKNLTTGKNEHVYTQIIIIIGFILSL